MSVHILANGTKTLLGWDLLLSKIFCCHDSDNKSGDIT